MNDLDGIVTLEGVSKSFGKTLAVDNLSLCINEREFLTLLGPSGCGKTTTLRLIAGFLKPDKGSIFIRGERVNEIPSYDRSLGMVFQNYALFPHMTAYENIAFGLRLRRVSHDAIKEKVERVLRVVQLTGVEHRYPRELSGGQQQRIALARALVVEPQVLLLDEPLSNLDLKLRMAMRIELKEIQRNMGLTAMYVTHDQGEALVLSDRIAVMNQGKIAQIGSPTEIYESPRNTFIADFVGEANFFEGEVSEISDLVRVKTSVGLTLFGQLVLDEEHKKTFGKNAKVSVSIRPEKIDIKERPTKQMNSFNGRITHRVYLGSYRRYYVALHGGSQVILDKPIVRSTGKDYPDEVYVEWDPENCIVIPKQT